jgi:hypothetical protein
MKRALIASILGLAASVASSYGQAAYFFDTYLGAGSPAVAGQVGWTSTTALAPAGRAGSLVTLADAFHADLLWAVGATTGDLGLLNTVPVSGGVLGYIQDPTSVTFDPSYTTGAISVTIQIWQGASYAAASQAGSGLGFGSVSWVEPGTTGGFPPIPFAAEPAGITSVSLSAVVPEPTTLALAGLGAAGMLLFRKRQ